MAQSVLHQNLVLKEFICHKAQLDIKRLESLLKEVEGIKGDFRLPASQLLRGLTTSQQSVVLDGLDNAIAKVGFTPRYYQYIALLMAALNLYWIEQLAEVEYLMELNAFAGGFEGESFSFSANDLHMLAFWMATASGKTLVLQVSIELLAQFGQKFDAIFLLSPNANLSQQHASELADLKGKNIILYSGENPSGNPRGITSNDILVSEFSKFVDRQVTGKNAKTLPIDDFKGRFLVLVDEGHKGQSGNTDTDESQWKKVQLKLAGLHDDSTNPTKGMIIEFSATLGQVAQNQNVLSQYAKSVAYDYAYDKFYADGYGKQPKIQNRHKQEYETALLASLLGYWHQLVLFEKKQVLNFAPEWQVEKPLWVMLGLTANSKKKSDQVKEIEDLNSDIQKSILFLRKVFDPSIFQKDLQALLTDQDLQETLPKETLQSIKKQSNQLEDLVKDIYRRVFGILTTHAPQLILRQIKSTANKEMGLGVFNGESVQYFGVVNIGSLEGYKAFSEKENIPYDTDIDSSSLFDEISSQRSKINILMGSRRFAEGWNNYRASTLSIMRLGTSEGALIVQMFGRMVRLKGVEGLGKRLVNVGDFQLLQTALIFGAGAGWLDTFISALEKQGIMLEAPKAVVQNVIDPINPMPQPKLVIRPKSEYQCVLDACWFEGINKVRKSLIYSGTQTDTNEFGVLKTERISSVGEDITPFFKENILPLINIEQIYFSLCETRQIKGWWNLVFSKAAISQFFKSDQYEIIGYTRHLTVKHFDDLERMQKLALQILISAVTAKYKKDEKAQSHYEFAVIPAALDATVLSVEKI
ncbi:MAG: DEAD/DEAH box helicase family protein [Pseudomonadota bacterium]|nr:DEAD/DEAH box helicase family protein [Pseudomonadota bacterium]